MDPVPKPTVSAEKRGEEKGLKCKLCDRKAIENGYCKLHKKAYESVATKYDFWRKALGITWKEYLSEIAKNPLTGQWTKEVAQQLVNVGEKENVEEG
jgi:hypothetical protein